MVESDLTSLQEGSQGLQGAQCFTAPGRAGPKTVCTWHGALFLCLSGPVVSLVQLQSSIYLQSYSCSGFRSSHAGCLDWLIGTNCRAALPWLPKKSPESYPTTVGWRVKCSLISFVQYWISQLHNSKASERNPTFIQCEGILQQASCTCKLLVVILCLFRSLLSFASVHQGNSSAWFWEGIPSASGVQLLSAVVRATEHPPSEVCIYAFRFLRVSGIESLIRCQRRCPGSQVKKKKKKLNSKEYGSF